MSERKLIAQHAFTVWVGQLAVMAFGVTDTVVAGRYDPAALAALSSFVSAAKPTVENAAITSNVARRRIGTLLRLQYTAYRIGRA